MKHIVMEDPQKSKIAETAMVVPNDNPILIQQKYVGVCMSEHYDWLTARPGMALGHEPMGIAEKNGKNTEGFAPGDRVSGLWTYSSLIERPSTA